VRLPLHRSDAAIGTSATAAPASAASVLRRSGLPSSRRGRRGSHPTRRRRSRRCRGSTMVGIRPFGLSVVYQVSFCSFSPS
jgi:hypothetical protein